MESTQLWSCQVIRGIAENYQRYLKEHNIYYEASECGTHVYMTFRLTETELNKLHRWLLTQSY